MWRTGWLVVFAAIAVQAVANNPKYRLISYDFPTQPVSIIYADGICKLEDGRRLYYGFEDNENYTRHYFFQKGDHSQFLALSGIFSSFVLNGFAQNGEVCGRINKDGSTRAVVTVGGQFVELPSTGSATAYRLNSSGLVVGFQIGTQNTVPVFWQNGTQYFLDSDGFTVAGAETVTEDGIIYGSVSVSTPLPNSWVVKWEKGVISYPFGKETVGRKVVSSPGGAMAAVTRSPDDVVRPRRILNGVVEALPAPPSKLVWDTRAINDRGDIVGFGYDPSQTNIEFQSFLWKGNEMYSADSLLQPDQSHIKIKALNHINNAGEISGLFLNTRTGLHEPGLLVPVPEPSLLGLSVGFALLAFRRCRRSST